MKTAEEVKEKKRKDAYNLYMRQYYQDNKEKILARNKANENFDRQKYYQENKEKRIEYQKQYYQKNKEKILAYIKKWQNKKKKNEQ